jgi:hypothetical protein
MNTTDPNLAPYEQRLLAELREVVAERAASAAVPARPRTRIAVGLSAAAALTVAAAVGASVLPGAGDRPAYAAERDPDGSIRILIREYRDAAGLQLRLRQLGVAAVVDYVPDGKQCREPRADFLPEPRGLVTHLPPEGGAESVMKLHPELIGPGQTFVFGVTIVGDLGTLGSGAVARIGLAAGPVGPCELVPGPVFGHKGG